MDMNLLSTIKNIIDNQKEVTYINQEFIDLVIKNFESTKEIYKNEYTTLTINEIISILKYFKKKIEMIKFSNFININVYYIRISFIEKFSEESSILCIRISTSNYGICSECEISIYREDQHVTPSVIPISEIFNIVKKAINEDLSFS